MPLLMPRSWPPPLCSASTLTLGLLLTYRAPTPAIKTKRLDLRSVFILSTMINQLTFRTVDLVAADGQQVDVHAVDVDRNLADSLRSIRVKEYLILPTYLT